MVDDQPYGDRNILVLKKPDALPYTVLINLEVPLAQVAEGQMVEQGQIIALSGMTGLATGPHLHYAVKRGGAFMNPLQLKVPREAPVAEKWMPDYREKISPLRAKLEGDLARL